MTDNDFIEVTRTIVYIGPREWVEHTLACSYIQPGAPQFFGSPGIGRVIKELSRRYGPAREEESA